MYDRPKLTQPSKTDHIFQVKSYPQFIYNSTTSTNWKTYNQSSQSHHKHHHNHNHPPKIYFNNEPRHIIPPQTNTNVNLPKNLKINFNYSNSLQKQQTKPMNISSLSSCGNSSSRKRNKIFDSSYLSKQINDPINKSLKFNEENQESIHRVKRLQSVQNKIQRKSSLNQFDSPIKYYNMGNSIPYKHQSFISTIPYVNQKVPAEIMGPQQNKLQFLQLPQLYPLPQLPQLPQKRVTFNYNTNHYQNLDTITSNKSWNYQEMPFHTINQQYLPPKDNSVPQAILDFKRLNHFQHNDNERQKNIQQFKIASACFENPSKLKIKKQFSLSKLNKPQKTSQNHQKPHQHVTFTQFPPFHPKPQQQKQPPQRQSPTTINKTIKSRGLLLYHNTNKQDNEQSFIESISNQRYFDTSHHNLHHHLHQNRISYHNIQIQKADDNSHDERLDENAGNIFLGFEREPSIIKYQVPQIKKTRSVTFKEDQSSNNHNNNILNHISKQQKTKIKETVPKQMPQTIPFNNKFSINDSKIALSLIAIAVLLLIIQLAS